MGPGLNNGMHPFVRHCSDCSTETGFVKRVQEGEPLYDGAMLLEPRPEEPGAFNVRGTYRSGQSDRSGPPKVTTNEYRDGWDRIFGSTPTVGQA